MSNKNCNSCQAVCSKNNKLEVQNGLNEETIKNISSQKNEPNWMLKYRLKAFDHFKNIKTQNWGPDLSNINFEKLKFYLKPKGPQNNTNWEDVNSEIKETFDNLGILESEKKYLAGLGTQYESEIVYHNLKKEWKSLGVIFLGTDEALKKHPELFKKYFGTIVPFNDNKFSALNSAFWSGGSFIYVPKNVKINIPLQAYFRINEQNLGQFERTLIIADEGAQISYIEGCTSQIYSSNSLHAAVVEVIAQKKSQVNYYTVQNWSKNIYNLVTKRALAEENATVEWVDANIGSKISMKYPCVILHGNGAKASLLSLSVAGFAGQNQDTGAKAVHIAGNTSSKIISKSLSSNGGIASFRGKIKIVKGAKSCRAFMQCDSLITDNKSQSNAYPNLEILEHDTQVEHEASISKIAEEKLFYLMSRGLNFNDAQSLIINGFLDSVTKNLPAEYAIEISRLVEMEINGGKNGK